MFDKDYQERIVEWLTTQQSNGFFEGFEEEEKDFTKCSKDELEWYFVEWYCDDLEELEEEDLKVFNYIINKNN